MKGVNFDFNGNSYRLALTAGALFDIYDIFGSDAELLSHIEPMTANGWTNTCHMLEILSRWGELQRRYLGEAPVPYLKKSDLLAISAPTDVRRLKDAVRATFAVGFSRSFRDGTHEVDLVLQKLDEKKTRSSSGHGWPERLRDTLGFPKKNST
ncbi:MAG: hypothetical protein EOM54_05630 [Clostridia bacterium]|nr:hypothetical protein [Clostridia bacterium]